MIVQLLFCKLHRVDIETIKECWETVANSLKHISILWCLQIKSFKIVCICVCFLFIFKHQKNQDHLPGFFICSYDEICQTSLEYHIYFRGMFGIFQPTYQSILCFYGTNRDTFYIKVRRNQITSSFFYQYHKVSHASHQQGDTYLLSCKYNISLSHQ